MKFYKSKANGAFCPPILTIAISYKMNMQVMQRNMQAFISLTTSKLQLVASYQYSINNGIARTRVWQWPFVDGY